MPKDQDFSILETVVNFGGNRAYIEGPVEIGIHDLDITINPNRLRSILNKLRDRKCIGYNELVVYTHT
ncbi:hypothetical protein KEJ27_09270 [Candidatus Bathyarchaeota archaeon]|nr:hypothetical protein [Candidatus Bathyarchaeota archaeon]